MLDSGANGFAECKKILFLRHFWYNLMTITVTRAIITNSAIMINASCAGVMASSPGKKNIFIRVN